MQPSPMAETQDSRSKIAFCIVITLCCKMRRNRMAFCSFRTPRYPFPRYGMPVWRRFPILPILCLILSYVLILCTFSLASSTLQKRKAQVTKPAQKTVSSAMEVGTELVSRIAAHAPSVGEHSTAIAG